MRCGKSFYEHHGKKHKIQVFREQVLDVSGLGGSRRQISDLGAQMEKRIRLDLLVALLELPKKDSQDLLHLG